MTTEALVEEAQDLIDRGKHARAADVLLTAAIDCHDPALAGRIKELGAQGLERSSWYRRGTWREVVRVAEKHTAATA
jgi:hypothetical protein